jgi:hypothetical protein
MHTTTWSGSSTNQVGPGAIGYVVVSMDSFKKPSPPFSLLSTHAEIPG